MPKFQIGDTVQKNTSYLPVTVLEIGTYEDHLPGGCHSERFRYKNPATGEYEWAHTGEFSLEMP